MFAKIVNGVLIYAPKDYVKEDGTIIVDFYKLPDENMEYGYKPLIDTKPEYDEDTQYLTLIGYSDDGEKIIVEYKVNDKPTPKPSIEEEVETLKQQLEITNQALQDLILTTVLNN